MLKLLRWKFKGGMSVFVEQSEVFVCLDFVGPFFLFLFFSWLQSS